MRRSLTVEISKKALRKASEALHADGIIIVPTQRWYMLCTKAKNDRAIERIFEAKQRPISKQPLFILPEKESTKDYFKTTEETDCLIHNLWPGDLSLLLLWMHRKISLQFKSMGQFCALVNNPSGFFGEIAKLTNEPLAATTVNVSMMPKENKLGPAICIDEVQGFLKTSALDVDLVIDGGISPAFNHTTILDCTDSKAIRMVRDGGVHIRAINIALGYDLFEV